VKSADRRLAWHGRLARRLALARSFPNSWAGRPCHSEPRHAHRVVVPEFVLLVRSGTGVPPVDLAWHGRPAHVRVDLCIKTWAGARSGCRLVELSLGRTSRETPFVFVY
jgi:hypothetical protein